MVLNINTYICPHINNNKMNTFTITFKNAMEEMKTEDFHLDFVTVQGVIAHFDEVFGIRVKSITKH